MKAIMRKILIELLNEETIVGSWGITNIDIADMSLSFDVSAMRYKGRISIEPKENIDTEVNVTFLDGSIDNIATNLSSIVEDVDKQIEYSDDYNSKLADWIHKQI